MPKRKAASVFPEPVGAWISVCSPEAIAGQPSFCAGVGSAKAPSNQARVREEKTSSAAMPASLVTLCRHGSPAGESLAATVARSAPRGDYVEQFQQGPRRG